ncbi:hypothetical protein GCM10009789_82280 [Kribbella sancticallisti]|uniref:Secreted protein n=1 Tax=Kribbella sancticallisti TaxID=460087 RepID=A0ABP4QRX3_9ACTN
MRQVKRMVAVASLAAAIVVLPAGQAVGANHTTAAGGAGPVASASQGTWGCGWNRPACESKQYEFRRFHCEVGPIYYLPTSGYWFDWFC